MTNQVNIVHVNLSPEQREDLLDRFPPRFVNVYCRHLMWAYRVPDDFTWPTGAVDLTITGYYLGQGYDTLVATVRDADGTEYTHQQTGQPAKLLHITHSTAEGMPPLAGGEIDADMIDAVTPFTLRIALVAGHARRLFPERRATA